MAKQKSVLRNVNKEHKENLSLLERVALFITAHVGTMGFFFIILTWTIFWLSWNTLAPREARFDPFPAFVLWLFISNMVQIFLMPLIMVGQNLQGRHAERRAQADYEVNLKSEQMTKEIVERLDQIQATLDRLQKKS